MAVDFLRPSRRRTVFSEALYVLLNLVLAGAIFAVVVGSGSAIPGVVLVLLSKWRVFAVRPQHWMAHLVSNMIDIIVGLSYVAFLSASDSALPVQVGLAVAYAMWLLLLKPRSSRIMVLLQAGVGVLVGVNALAQVTYGAWSSVFVVAMWVIGYSAARHVLGAYKEPHTAILSLLWGLVFAEIGWVTYHWTFAYDLYVTANLQLSQVALISVVLSFLAERVYANYHSEKTIRFTDVVLPLLLTVSIIGVLLTVFGTVKTF